MWGSSTFLGGQPRRPKWGGDPASPKFWGPLYMRELSMRNDEQILHGDQTRCDENFRVDRECGRVICLC